MRVWVRLCIVGFWLLMTGWFVRYEAFPGYFIRASAGYQTLLRDAPLIMDSWMKILFQGTPIGYSHTLMDTRDGDPAERFIVSNQTQLDLNILGARQHVAVSADAALDAVYRLQRFQFALSSDRYSTRIRGERKEGERFDVEIKTKAGTQKLSIDIPDDVIVYSPATDLVLSRLRVGQQRRLRTLDPASLATMDVLVEALARETITVGGSSLEATRLRMDYNGMEVHAWMDSKGRMLRQETPFGWTLEACSASEALALTGRSPDSPGLLAAMAVPVTGGIRSPRLCRELRLRLTGAPLDPDKLSTERQTIEHHDGLETVLRLSRALAPAQDTLGEGVVDAYAEYLAATPFIQSSHPVLVRRARDLAGDRTDPMEVARIIGDWVHRKVVKNPAVSLPSALDVLEKMEGDCNEHTYLFVALARAAGIPAKVCVGLVYMEDAFYYHAWPAVYAGAWVEMDPTLGQERVDAAHVVLLEGELADQLGLMSMVGRMQAEILEEHY